MAALGAVWRALPAGRVVGDGVDLSGTLWHYWWMARCIATGQDPRTTDLMYYPLGKDLFAANGSNLVDALASVPLQWLLGPIDSQAWFVAGVLLLNAATFRPLARHVLGSPLAVVVATLAWQLNPYVLFELADGRITQAMLPFVPLALLFFLRCLGPQGTRWDGVLAGFFTAAQAWTYWFMGWFLAAAFAWLVVHRLWRATDRRAVLGRVAVAGGVCLVLVAVPALSMFQALEVPGPLNPDTTGPPGRRAHKAVTGQVGSIPFLGPGPWMLDMPAMALGVILWLFVGPERARWGGVLGMLVWLGIGPSVALGPAFPVVQMWPYQAAMEVLPFFDRLWFPPRAMSVGMVPVVLAIGFVVRHVERRRVIWAQGIAVAWCLLAFVGLQQLRLFPLTSKEVVIPETVRWMGEQPPGAIIHLPFALNQRYLVWQLEVPLPHLGGLGESSPLHWPKDYWSRIEADPLRGLLEAARLPGLASDWQQEEHGQFLRAEGFRWVVFHKDRGAMDVRSLPEPPGGWTFTAIDQALDQLMAQLSKMLGPPIAVEGNLVTWDLWRQAIAPPELVPTPEKFSVRTWGREESPPHVQVLKEDDRHEFTRLPGWHGEEEETTAPKQRRRRGMGGRPGGTDRAGDQSGAGP